MKLTLPESIATALPVLKRLREHQFEAVFVGGCVRDTVLDLPVKDVDIATSARPEQVLELFERCIPTGLQHGTVTVLSGKSAYEVTTYRRESKYETHRRPESVQFISSLEGDLQRRDFTMNAMALTEEGGLIDPFKGLEDLKNGVLRCVGDPNARFQEDALRMLRAVRFIGAYNLRPSQSSWQALIRYRKLMKYIAMERVLAELDKMMAGKTPERALYFTAASGLLHYLKEPMPEEAVLAVDEAYGNRCADESFSKLNRLKETDLRWAAVLMSLSLAGDSAEQTLQSLRFSKLRIKTMISILSIHKQMLDAAINKDEPSIRLRWVEMILMYGKKLAGQWLEIVNALQPSLLNGLNVHVRRLEDWLDAISITTLKQLHVSGRELTEHLDRESGPWISEWLNRLLLEAALGHLPNEKQALLEQAESWDKEETNHE